jgi:ketosteroid isomerase-like protein
MSQENVEVVRQMYEVFHSGDADGALAHFDPNVVVDASRARPDGGRGMTMFATQEEALEAAGLRE